MKILIDDGLSTLQQLGGIGHNSINLWKHLQKIIDCDITDYHYLERMPRVVKRAAYMVLANLVPFQRRYDLIHYQNYYIPRFIGRVKGVTTIHDLGGFKAPGVYQNWYNVYFRRVLRKAVERSDAMILPSAAVKEDLLNLFPGAEESRTHICHTIGIRDIFFEHEPVEQDLIAMDLQPYSYFLFIGNLENRKNLPFLLSGFVAARKQALVGRGTKLVLVGKEGIGYDDFRHYISKENQIVHLGRLSDEELVLLYRFCKAFVFPSLFEGFGVPTLEAMSQNAPILLSNIPPSLDLNRQHNDQCFVFELGNEEAFLERLSYLDKNAASIRGKLKYGDLSVHSYDQIAQEYLKIYNQIL